MNKRWIIVAVVVVGLFVALWLGSQDSGDGDSTDDIDSGDDNGDDGQGTLSQDDGGGILSTASDNFISVWAKAIQQFEGYFPGSASYRNNNPGNMEIAGDEGFDGVWGKFSTFALGEAALLNDLAAKVAKYPEATLNQIANRYANGTSFDDPASNNPSSYASFLAQKFTAAFGQVVTGATTLAELNRMG